MISHTQINTKDLHKKIRQQKIALGGNRKLKIYGTLSCASGKRLKRENRVFFSSEEEAGNHNFRPCGHCMRTKYKIWKNGLI